MATNLNNGVTLAQDNFHSDTSLKENGSVIKHSHCNKHAG